MHSPVQLAAPDPDLTAPHPQQSKWATPVCGCSALPITKHVGNPCLRLLSRTHSELWLRPRTLEPDINPCFLLPLLAFSYLWVPQAASGSYGPESPTQTSNPPSCCSASHALATLACGCHRLPVACSTTRPQTLVPPLPSPPAEIQHDPTHLRGPQAASSHLLPEASQPDPSPNPCFMLPTLRHAVAPRNPLCLTSSYSPMGATGCQ